jgi:hypothetical protein
MYFISVHLSSPLVGRLDDDQRRNLARWIVQNFDRSQFGSFTL